MQKPVRYWESENRQGVGMASLIYIKARSVLLLACAGSHAALRTAFQSRQGDVR